MATVVHEQEFETWFHILDLISRKETFISIVEFLGIDYWGYFNSNLTPQEAFELIMEEDFT